MAEKAPGKRFPSMEDHYHATENLISSAESFLSSAEAHVSLIDGARKMMATAEKHLQGLHHTAKAAEDHVSGVSEFFAGIPKHKAGAENRVGAEAEHHGDAEHHAEAEHTGTAESAEAEKKPPLLRRKGGAEDKV